MDCSVHSYFQLHSLEEYLDDSLEYVIHIAIELVLNIFLNKSRENLKKSNLEAFMHINYIIEELHFYF